MAKKKDADDSGPLGQFLRALGSSTRHNSLAYGCSLAITSSFGMLALLDRSPDVADLFVFAIGAAATFTIANAVVTRGYRVKTQDEPPVVVAFGASFGMVSVVGSIGIAALCGWLRASWLGWLVGGFGASTGYIVLGAFELVGAYALRAFLGEHSLEER